MTRKKSKPLQIFFLICVILSFSHWTTYRSSQVPKSAPTTNIQSGSAYRDTTEGFEIVYPDNTWGVLRYDEVEIRLSRGWEWNKSASIATEVRFNPETFKIIHPHPIVNSQEFHFTYPTYHYESRNTTSVEMEGEEFLQRIFVVLPKKVVVFGGESEVTKFPRMDLIELAKGVREIPVTTGTILGWGYYEDGTYHIYHGDKTTIAAIVFVTSKTNHGYRIMLRPGVYYFETPFGLRMTEVKLGETEIFDARE